jgi:hypothetical protein
MPRYA